MALSRGDGGRRRRTDGVHWETRDIPVAQVRFHQHAHISRYSPDAHSIYMQSIVLEVLVPRTEFGLWKSRKT